MHEVITLQLGERSSFLGTHFWNTQEHYFTYAGPADQGQYEVDGGNGNAADSIVDHDVHFRAGKGADGADTFLPRTVIYDLKDGFGSMRQINALYEAVGREQETASEEIWNRAPTVIPTDRIQPHPYQLSLDAGLAPSAPLSDDTVRFWSDYNRMFYHPRSLVPISARPTPPDRWETGEDLFQVLDNESSLFDRDFRPFVEESDLLQGVQIISSVDDMWGGFAARYLDVLRDELGKTSIWVFGTSNGKRQPQARQNVKMYNLARSFCASPQASLYIPMEEYHPRAPSFVSLENPSKWRISGLQAAAVSTVTLPSRMRGSSRIARDTTEALVNVNGKQNIAQLSLGILPSPSKERITGASGSPVPKASIATEPPKVLGNGASKASNQDLSLFPGLHGDPKQRKIRRTDHTFGKYDVIRSKTLPESRESIRQKTESREETVQTDLEFPLLDSFPHVFNLENPNAKSLGLRSSLETSTSVPRLISQLQHSARSYAPADEREDISNTLAELEEQYREGWESESGSEDD